MKRSELYEMVWTKPMTKLALELGISDVGLAKACRRHAVPVPPRGYWAKLQAGKLPPRTPFPAPELDVVVDFMTTDPGERARQKAQRDKGKELVKSQIAEALSKVSIGIPEVLVRPHPLVAETMRFSERVPKLISRYQKQGYRAWLDTKPQDRPPSAQHGRYAFFREGVLNITASLESMNWILRFHDALLKALAAAGMYAEWNKPEVRHRREPDACPCIQLSQSEEVFTLQFVQGYKRVRLTSAELAEKKKKDQWAREYEFGPSDKFSLRVNGTEYRSSRTWEGSQEKLQGQLSEVVRGILELVPMQKEARAEREDKEIQAQKRAEEAALQRRKREAREELLKQAFGIAETYERVQRLSAFLTNLEGKLDEFPEPLRGRSRVWLQVVREELDETDAVGSQFGASVNGPSWRSWPPDWWPKELGPEE